jgi:hypothetical protein
VTPAATPLPASNLAIATPPAEPDPIGLKAALDVLKTPGIFNNLSGIDSLKGLLGSLSDAAAKVATAKKPDTPAPAPTPSPARALARTRSESLAGADTRTGADTFPSASSWPDTAPSAFTGAEPNTETCAESSAPKPETAA